MKLKILPLLIVCLAIVACRKAVSDGHLALTAVSTTALKPGDVITFSFLFSDNDKGSTPDTLYMIKALKTCPQNDTWFPNDTLAFAMPTYTPPVINADMTFSLCYQWDRNNTSNPILARGCANNNGVQRADSATFYFWFKNENGTTSDTAKSSAIYLGIDSN